MTTYNEAMLAKVLNICIPANLNPNPIGLFEGLESIGGGPIWPPPQISATQEPIDLKLGTDIKQVEKNKNQKEK